MNNKREIKTMNFSYYNRLSFLYIYEFNKYHNGLDSYCNKIYKNVTIDNSQS